jgi:hypothetical protein
MTKYVLSKIPFLSWDEYQVCRKAADVYNDDLALSGTLEFYLKPDIIIDAYSTEDEELILFKNGMLLPKDEDTILDTTQAVDDIDTSDVYKALKKLGYGTTIMNLIYTSAPRETDFVKGDIPVLDTEAFFKNLTDILVADYGWTVLYPPERSKIELIFILDEDDSFPKSYEEFVFEFSTDFDRYTECFMFIDNYFERGTGKVIIEQNAKRERFLIASDDVLLPIDPHPYFKNLKIPSNEGKLIGHLDILEKIFRDINPAYTADSSGTDIEQVWQGLKTWFSNKKSSQYRYESVVYYLD